MTKQIRIIALVLMLVFSFSTLVGCANLEGIIDSFKPTTECEHVWVDASCELAKTCSICGETEGEALGHTEVLDASKAPTCTDKGLTEGK